MLVVIVAWLVEAYISHKNALYFTTLLVEMRWLPELSWTTRAETEVPEAVKLESLSTQEEV